MRKNNIKPAEAAEILGVSPQFIRVMVMAKQGKKVYHTRNTTTKATAVGRSAAAAERVGLENENSSSSKFKRRSREEYNSY